METIDWIIIAFFLIALTAIGFVFSGRNRNIEDYFAAGRSMPGWLVALAATGTSISAGTFIGSPELGFNTNLTFIMSCFGAVVGGLLVTGRMFDFFALLGLLGLVGMNIKNAVVLVVQIDSDTRAGMTPYQALVSATRSRVVPVMAASITTILGMLPLLFDAMFGGMAATIMGGLLMASLLTVFFLPVCYSLFFNITAEKQ